MKKLFTGLMSVVLAAVMIICPITALGADESSYTASFTLSASKTANIAKNDTVTVSVSLKTNYGLYAMGLPVIYDCTKFEMMNTDPSNLSSFLTFSGTLATSYLTNGNWKSPDVMYSRCSNPSYWTKSTVKSTYKIAYATWSADSTKSKTPITLSSSQKIVSFTLKAKKAVSTLTDKDIFVSKDFLKTESCAGGLLFAGRCVGKTVSENKFQATGQTLNFKYSYAVEPDEFSVDMNYKKSIDLMDTLSDYKKSSCTFKSSDTSVVSLDGSVATGVSRGTALVTVKDSSTGKTANITVNVKFSFLQWLIEIFLFGWIWY